MDSWIDAQENPIHRFQKPLPWENEGIISSTLEEMTYKMGIQKLLQKLLCDKYNGFLTAGESLTLHSLLHKYCLLKRKNAGYVAMNVQMQQMDSILDNLSMKQKYVEDLNGKEKKISNYMKSKYILPRKLDKLESKLKIDIDKIDDVNVTARIDNVINPLVTEIKEEQESMEYSLFDEDDGVLYEGMKDILNSCMPPLADGRIDTEASNLISQECLKKCLHNEAINMKDITLTQYHLPSIPESDIPDKSI